MEEQSSIKKILNDTLESVAPVAKLFGIADPTSATIGMIADSISQRRINKSLKQFEKLLKSLESRIRNLENASLDEVCPDLLAEIIAEAVKDEDEEKTEYYAAFIDYYISHPQLQPNEIRILVNAFQSLTISEITAFFAFACGENYRNYLNDDEMIFWSQVHSARLYKGSTTSVKHISQLTKLGKKFVEICKLVE